MFALVDAVSFYASAEKVFDPSIRNKPVVVLTNNDGCICAVCPIARRLGIPKFKPYFKIKSFLKQHNVVVRSSNYELYADLSDQMMNVIARFCDNQHIYSIDESFLEFKHYQKIINSWHDYGHLIRNAVWKETRLPVGVGFGITPTLAKAANHAAKKLSGFNGVAVIDDMTSAAEILKRMDVSEVWGVGNKLTAKLKAQGIDTAFKLSQQPAKAMRKQFSVVLERTINELNGQICLSWEDVKAAKQEIFSTRSFGQRICDINTLQSALATHAGIVAKKLRQQNSLVKKVMIFASSSPHDANYYKQSIVYEFPQATDNTCVIASAVALVINYIYRHGVFFYRCGVGAISLESKQFRQADLFIEHKENPQLMSCFDAINHRFGQGTLALASQGQSERWQMSRNFLSPQFTSNWRDIPKITC
ncbi:MAG: Y-family DNA polymerase [Thalassotalea sp.]|nr:Y-family DNA polymerase [Thalassotalea sp.]